MIDKREATMAHVLIVDDERDLCTLLATLLKERGHSAQSAPSGEAALARARERRPDLVLLDLQMDGIDGIETLRRFQKSTPSVPVVMMTAFGNVSAAVSAMKLGAVDFVTKPFSNEALLSTVDTLLVMQRGARSEACPALIGESPLFRRALDLTHKFAVPDINVLLLGETGTGKELFARMIHAASKRHKGPFVAVDCSMLPENLIESEIFGHEKGAFTGATGTRVGRFELAQGGTLFLDEIGNLPVPFQAKLLRVLQERRMERVGGRETIRLDVRLISATNLNLQEASRTGSFRQDLYYRLNEMTICLPPLREREGDVHRLAKHFVEQYAARFGKPVRGISEEALRTFDEYRWPGNVRELENAIKSAVVLADDWVLPEHLPPEILGNGTSVASVCATTAGESEEERLRVEIELALGAAEIDLKALGSRAAEQAERSLLAALLRRGRVSAAQLARLLRIDPKTLRMKLRKYGLDGQNGSEPLH